MARRSKNAKKEQRNQILILLGVVTLCLSVMGFLSYLWFTKQSPPDPVTLCPAGGPEGHTIVLVDNTEPFTFIQKQGLTQHFADVAENKVPEGHLLSVFVLGQDFTENAMPIFEKCNPGTGEGRSSLTSTPKRIKQRFDSEYVRPLLALRKEFMLEKPSDRSPVFEMLQLVAINGFKRVGADGPRKLIVYSDMLPHMPEFSMFKSLPDFKTFSAGAYGRKSQASLDGVEVHLNYLINYPNLQTTKQAAFWEQYFDNSGAQLVEIDTFEG